MPNDRPPRRRHLRAVPPLLRPAPLHQGRGPAVRRGASACCSRCCEMIEQGATHLGVATDHVIESFRNDLWPGYKTGGRHRAGAAARSSIRSRRRSPRWASSSGRWSSSRPTTRSPRRRASPPPTRRVEKVCIWTPDKDLAQCVRGDRVVQVDRERQGDPRRRRRAREVRRRAGADSRLPGARRRRRRRLSGDRRHRRGRRGAAAQPPRRDRGLPARGARRAPPQALLFKQLATLRTDAPLFERVEELRWRGPTAAFAAWTERAKRACSSAA